MVDTLVMCLKVIFFFAFLTSSWTFETAKPCHSVKTKYGSVCLCDKNYCDTLYVPFPKEIDSYVLITSSESGDRFSYTNGKFTKKCEDCNTKNVHLKIGHRISHRKVIGFGGAFTGATSYVLSRLPLQLQKFFYKSYFSRTFGMGYTLIRIPIGGTDFDFDNWVYNLHPANDTRLSNFQELDPRDKLRNQQMRLLMNVCKNHELKILTAAWYAPPWMRAKNDWVSTVDNQILPQYYQTWADYHVRWLNLMKRDGIPIWGLSPGNEPHTMSLYVQSFMSWNATNHGKWFAEYLKPSLKSNGYGNIKILGVDDMLPVMLIMI